MISDTFESSLDARLCCPGEFDFLDAHCRERCAVSIRCAVVKNDLLRREILEGDPTYDRAFVLTK
jgi:hypothetical protein